MPIMTQLQALTSPLSFMTVEELRYVIAFSEGQQRAIGLWHPEMDKWERRQQAAQAELAKRK